MLADANKRPRRPAPPDEELEQLILGFRNTQLLYVAARLGLADVIQGGSPSGSDVAHSVGAHPPTLHRILRGLVNLGILVEDKDNRFHLTPRGEYLRSDAPGALRGLAIRAGEMAYSAWGGLLHSVLTGENAFEHVLGMGMFEYLAQHPDLQESFNASQAVGTRRVAAAIVDAYDFASARTVVDLGGGQGLLLAATLKGNPHLQGVLFDTPAVVASAKRILSASGVAARCRIVGGDFFESVPAGADIYLLKYIVHDWDDARAGRILGNCRHAMALGSKLLLVEHVMPEYVRRPLAVVEHDLTMLVLHGGRERTRGEYEALLAEAGLALTRIISTTSPFSIVEAVPIPETGPSASSPSKNGAPALFVASGGTSG